MRFSIFFSVLAGCLMTAWPSFAVQVLYIETPTPMCAREFARAAKKAKFAEVASSPDLPRLHPSLSGLDPRVQRWIRIRNSPAFDREYIAPIKKIGEKITLGNGEYEIVARLGQGAEGNVYLVNTHEGVRVAKTFFYDEAFAKNWEYLRTERSMRTPKILKVDISRNTMLLEHLEVIPVQDIELTAETFGITAAQRADILARWAQERRRAAAIRHFAPADYNVGFSFHDDDFQMFDPH